MRRSRLVEPRSRARSISPHRQSNQRDTRSQSVVRGPKERKTTNNEGVSRSEWFDTEVNYTDSESTRKVAHPSNSSDDWLKDNITEDNRTVVAGRGTRIAKKPRTWQDSTGSTVIRTIDNSRRKEEDSTNDLRKSILECNVNPYLLVKKHSKDEDDLSDDLSDNALEAEDISSSSLFDPSKVKSIERVPNRNAVAAIGGQRIRVFTEPREISDEDEHLPVTRIPIPKVSPKRPPRRPKETKITVKSILKRGKSDGIRKNVLFNVNNVIFAPEKPNDIIGTIRRVSRSSVIVKPEVPEQPIIPAQQLQERPRFITIPNIKEPKRLEKRIISSHIFENRIIPEFKTFQPLERKVERNLKRPEVPVRNKKSPEIPEKKIMPSIKTELVATIKETKITMVEEEIQVRPEDETNLEIEIEELKDRFAAEDKDLLLKADDGKIFFYFFFFLELFIYFNQLN